MPLAVAAPSAPRGGDPRIQKLSPDKVQKLLDCAKTPRIRELEKYQAFYEGNAYEGRAYFYDDDKPLQERAPNVIYRLACIAAESNKAFAMGEGRFPTVLSLSSENDDTFDKALGLSGDDSQTVDSFNAKLIELANLEVVFGCAYKMAQASRSVATVLGYRNGVPFADLIWAKLCSPEFKDPRDPYCCTKLSIRYRYTEQWRDPNLTNGEWWTRVFEYLRVVDDTYDTVFKPVPIWEETDEGATERSPILAQTTHGFGLCPVHWYARNRASVVGTNYDGYAVHDGLCQMLEQLDLSISQKHRAAVYMGDPTTVLTGVSAEEDPVGTLGRKATPQLTALDGADPNKQWNKSFLGSMGQGGQALRRGCSQVWRIQDPSGKATILALDKGALDALDADGKDLARMLCDDMGVTIVDPATFSGGGDLSGRTLAFIFSKQINRVSEDRKDLGRCLILPILNLYYRMLLARPDGVYLPGLAKVLPILGRFYKSIPDIDPQATPGKFWFAPQLKLKWGDYFEPSDVDESTRTTTAISAYNAKIITLQSAVEHVRGIFNIGSVDQYVDTLQDEVEQRAQQEVQKQQAIRAPSPNNPSAQQSPNSAPPASGAPKAKRVKPKAASQ